MSWSRLVLLLVAVQAIYVAYIFHVPVPDNINQSFTYRMFVAGLKFNRHVAQVANLIVPGVLTRVKVLRGPIWFLTEYLLPSGEIYAPDVKLQRDVFDGVKVNIYTPPDVTEADLLTGFIYIHGGGLSLLNPDYYDGLTRQISKKLKAVVVSIDYRLTPEHTFPIPYEDSLRATRWFLQNAKTFGVDAKRVAIGGDSAGGYLSTAVAQAIYDDPEIPNIKLQVLVYPWLQVADLNTPSYQKFRQDFGSEGITSLEKMAWFSAMHIYGEKADDDIIEAFMTNNHTSKEFKESALFRERLSHTLVPTEHRAASYYTRPTHKYPNTKVGEKISSESKDLLLDPRMCPLFRRDLSGLPVTYIVTVEYDSLRDDGIMYGKLLKQAGVDVTWRHYENAFHGIVWAANGIVFDDGARILNEMLVFVKARL